MTESLVDRLREFDAKTANPPFWSTGICGEAADEIERLRAERESDGRRYAASFRNGVSVLADAMVTIDTLKAGIARRAPEPSR